MSGPITNETTSLKFNTGLRGYHVYCINWKPYLKQQLAFKPEKDNKCDRFAVAGQTRLPETLFPSTVGHIPIELSRYIWYALKRGAIARGEVTSIRQKPSPLIQGGLEIPVEVTVVWEDEKAMEILRDKVDEVGYPVGDEQYPDESKEILKYIFSSSEVSVPSDESDDEEAIEVIEEESNDVIVVS